MEKLQKASRTFRRQTENFWIADGHNIRGLINICEKINIDLNKKPTVIIAPNKEEFELAIKEL